MCQSLIIDASAASDLLYKAEYAPIRDAIEDKKMPIQLGGKNTKELYDVSLKFTAWIIGRRRDGRAHVYDEDDINTEESKLAVQKKKKAIIIQSNDEHILALARASRTRHLLTNDIPLVNDFKNTLIIKQGKTFPTFHEGERGTRVKNKIKNMKNTIISSSRNCPKNATK